MQVRPARNAVQVILREHLQLSAITEGMQRIVDTLGTGATTAGPMVLRAMVYYIREYPERIHHPKEDQYLFARLKLRTHDFDEIITGLEAQHAQGDASIRDIERALTRYEMEGEGALPQLRATVGEYAAFCRIHRRVEEEIILPAAQRWLTTEDWIELDDVFGANHDPFEGAKLDDDFERLLALLMQIMPGSSA